MSILSNDNNLITAERINNCTVEEADPRLVRHAMHCAEKGFHNIVVRTIDTDVLVLLISYIPYLDAVCQSNIVVRTIDTDVLVLLISCIPYLDAVCHSNIVVRTIDTDVLVLLISYIPYLDAVCQSNIVVRTIGTDVLVLLISYIPYHTIPYYWHRRVSATYQLHTISYHTILLTQTC